MAMWDKDLLADARALEAELLQRGIDPADHSDADVDELLEQGYDWPVDDLRNE
jgi:hypothetical protein